MLVIVLGAIAAGAWVSQPISSFALRTIRPSAEYKSFADMLPMLLSASAAHLVGAAVAGLVPGIVADGGSTTLWLTLFLGVWILWMSGPTILSPHRANGSLLWALAAQALIWLVGAGAFWISARLRGRPPVA